MCSESFTSYNWTFFPSSISRFNVFSHTRRISVNNIINTSQKTASYSCLHEHVINIVVQPLSCVQLFATPWTAAHQASLSFTISPRLCSNSCPLSQWRHPTISSSVVPFSSCLQSFTSSGSFPKTQFFASGGQSIAASASASVLPMNIQDWFPLGPTGLISLQSRDSQESSPAPQFKSISSLALSFLYGPALNV